MITNSTFCNCMPALVIYLLYFLLLLFVLLQSHELRISYQFLCATLNINYLHFFFFSFSQFLLHRRFPIVVDLENRWRRHALTLRGEVEYLHHIRVHIFVVIVATSAAAIIISAAITNIARIARQFSMRCRRATCLDFATPWAQHRHL